MLQFCILANLPFIFQELIKRHLIITLTLSVK